MFPDLFFCKPVASHLCRISRNAGIRWHILCHNAPSCYNGTSVDMGTCENYCTVSDSHIVFNDNLLTFALEIIVRIADPRSILNGNADFKIVMVASPNQSHCIGDFNIVAHFNICLNGAILSYVSVVSNFYLMGCSKYCPTPKGGILPNRDILVP